MRKFKCINSFMSGDYLTEGKIYTTKDRQFTYDNGWVDTSFNFYADTFDGIGLSKFLVEITDNKQEKESNMKFKIGDVVEIIGNNNNHRFKIGEKVKLYAMWDTTETKYGCAFLAEGEDGRHYTQSIVRAKDLKLIKDSTQSFTITVSDTITTLKSADKTVEIKRYHEDKHDVKVAIDNVVKKYFDEVEEEERIKNRPTKGEGLLGVKVPKGTKFKVINIEPHDDKGRVCMSEYIGKIGTFNRDFTFNKGGFHSSGTFDEEYMDAIDKKNGKLCWRYDEVEILWED